MKISVVENCTRVLSRPSNWNTDLHGQCCELPVRDEVTSAGAAMTSAWTPTPDEVQAIAGGAQIYLTVFGAAHPPVSLGVGTAPAADGIVICRLPDDKQDWTPEIFPGGRYAKDAGCTCPEHQPWPGRLKFALDCPIHQLTRPLGDAVNETGLIGMENRAAMPVVAAILNVPTVAGGEPRDALPFLATVVTNVILATVRLGGDQKVLETLIADVNYKLAKHRIVAMEPAGTA